MWRRSGVTGFRVARAGLLRAIRQVAAEFPPARWMARAAVWLIAPRHRIGAVGVVFDRQGRVLVVEHAFRTDFPWGLPGGWVQMGEEPREAVKRELREELRLDVEVGELVLSGIVRRVRTSIAPVHLGLAYACELASGSSDPSLEVLRFDWIDPASPRRELAPFQRAAIARALAVRAPR